jgi:hypothetical protein
MARYDQVEPHVGIVRAPLAADITFPADGEFGPVGVSLDANGRVVIGTAGQSGFIGVLVKNVPTIPAGTYSPQMTINNWMGGRAGDIVDVMIQGQILDTDLPAGSAVYAAADGTLGTVAGGARVGYTVEAGRLVVDGRGA